MASFAAIRENPFELKHDPAWLAEQGLVRDGEQRFIEALRERISSDVSPLGEGQIGPGSWGSQAWQTTALNNGGRRMLSTGGARSSQRKRHRTRRLLRTMRDGVVGFGWLSQWLRR